MVTKYLEEIKEARLEHCRNLEDLAMEIRAVPGDWRVASIERHEYDRPNSVLRVTFDAVPWLPEYGPPEVPLGAFVTHYVLDRSCIRLVFSDGRRGAFQWDERGFWGGLGDWTGWCAVPEECQALRVCDGLVVDSVDLADPEWVPSSPTDTNRYINDTLSDKEFPCD